MALAGLAALVLATHVFVDADRLRVKVVEGEIVAADGIVRAPAYDLPELNGLRSPFALIARIDGRSGETNRFSIAVDGTPVCERSVAGEGARRVDCAITDGWNPALEEHEVTIRGPSTEWRLEYLELATHHGNTSGAHYLLVLPASSDHYTRPGPVWVLTAWLLITAMLLMPAPAPLPRWIQLGYRVAAGLTLLELALCFLSQFLSPYRVVLSAHTFALSMLVLFVPRLWAAGRDAMQGVARGGSETRLRRTIQLVVPLVFVGGVLTVWRLSENSLGRPGELPPSAREIRQALRDELRVVTLKNCTLKRYGGANDGGYLVCDNLLSEAESAYSYGIAGEDNWGCALSRTFSLPVHQYDCFDTTEPACIGGRFVFHPECIGRRAEIIENRPFDTLTNQIVRNGDKGKRLVVKMDVEGAEWDSLLATPDEVLDRIDQLPMELHGTDERRFLRVVRKLKRTFHLAHIHFNNMACTPAAEPLPAFAYQVLFVSRRIGIEDLSASAPTLPNPADAPDNPAVPDCQRID